MIDIMEMIRKNDFHLPGGGSYSFSDAVNGFTVVLTMNRSCTERVKRDLTEIIHRYFQSGHVKAFRVRSSSDDSIPKPTIYRGIGSTEMSFPDGSRIILLQDGSCYPFPAVCGHSGWVKGKRAEEYKAYKFFRMVGEERARAAIQRWNERGFPFPVVEP